MQPATEILTPDANGIARAADLLRAGKLVAFPTETVYGLGGIATRPDAVASIYAAKGRPSFNPLIAHVADLDTARRIAHFSDMAEALAAAFWPGPMTLVLPLREGHGLAPGVTAGLETVALRIPAAPVAQRVLERVGQPVAAPSANPSGRISPTRAEHVIAGLSGRIAAVLDGGACPVGVESTIVATDPAPRILRAGGLSAEAISAALGLDLAAGPVIEDSTPTAPGQLTSHYAPSKPVRLNATAALDDEVWLGFGPVAEGQHTLSQSRDLAEAAANLFDMLHNLDDGPHTGIAVAPIPDTGLGAAINDRLQRAAAPRPRGGTPEAG